MTFQALPRGRPGVGLTLIVEKHLTHQEVVEFAAGVIERVPVPVAGIQRVKAIHHAAARLLASGKTATDVAYAVGCSVSRVAEWENNDPAFRDLVEYYRKQIDDISMSDAQRVQLKLLNVAETALDEIGDRVEGEPRPPQPVTELQKLPMSELREIVKMGLDRTIAPPRTAQPPQHIPTKITFNIGTRDIRPSDETDPHAPSTQTITVESEE